MKPIFSRNADIAKMAFMNWRIDKDQILNMLNMADGFLIGSLHLARQALTENENKEADITIFPILTNANHGIELYLKSMTWTLNEITETGTRVEGSHDIHQIYKTVRSKIKVYGGKVTPKGFDERMEGLSKYINELSAKIKTNKDNMDFSRYPMDNKYIPHFYVMQTGNVEVDLENFVERFTKIHQALDETASFLFHQELNGDW